eukprot:TRINITY_DN2203_c0_g1_i3.p1 TRINITY_DN2203_c0_g1~~TRINITY_DN2203_c0_g1_i3.p1  ORF type:complete len:1236 (+),score=387.58 TRINITY_DN2203_c0_g1_i3:144-3851(+)
MSSKDDDKPLLSTLKKSVNSSGKRVHYGSDVDKEEREKEKNEEHKKEASKFGRKFRSIFTSQSHERKSTEEKEDEYETNSQGMREVFVGKPEDHDFRHGNEVKTSKYTIITFLFLNTFEQFRRLANLYFLVNSGIALIPSISPVNPITTVLPLAFVFGVTAIKEGWEDWKRHRSDHKVNSSKTQCFNVESGKFEETKWSKLKVGQVIKMKDGDQIPADVVLLSSSEEKGIAFVEASSLDGEAGLRRKEPLKQTSVINNEEKLKEWISQEVMIECERPNEKMSSFEGRIQIKNPSSSSKDSSDESGEEGQLPLTLRQVLLRGCTLQSTEWAYGIVVFTGHDTKTMRNAKPPKFKLSAFEHSINHFLTILLVFTIAIMVFSSALSTIWNKKLGDVFYLPAPLTPFMNIITSLPTFLILYNVVIPISLYVSMEMVKVALTFFITHDASMYDEETDTRAKPRTSSIIEELGQIGYIFADKTGTLTVNVMKLMSCSIGGTVYDFPEASQNEFTEGKDIKKSKENKGKNEIEDRKDLFEYLGVEESKEDKKTKPSSKEKTSKSSDSAKGKEKGRSSPKISNRKEKKSSEKGEKGEKGEDPVEDFMFLLAICNSVIPQPDPNDESKTIFSGSSPDESALVESAKRAGYTLEGRSLETATINGEEYQVLNNIEFTSERKKMSSIIKTSDGKIVLYSKGADSAILENLSSDGGEIKEETEKHIKAFAEEGLRTLCMAKKEIKEEEYNSWNEKYQKACASLKDRDKNMEEVSAEIEKDLTLIGAVAIEDKLQKDVPESIQTLRDAGLKVWVLTGDKLETAVNIAKTAKLIDMDSMNVVVIKKDGGDVIKQIGEAKGKLEKKEKVKEGEEEKENAMVVDGSALEEIFKKNKDQFFEASNMCKSVLVCRASPLQKSEVVALYKEKQKKKLLAIGDGANDVSMIREAHVGVGISGKEGMQAALSSDYAIAQFRFLTPLLLHHGRWAYKRLSKLVLYSFYKNITFCMCQFWFAWYNNFSGQTLFDSWSLSMFNTLFTSVPILVVAAFDQDVSKKSMKLYPQLYQECIDEPSFSLKWATLWFIEGLIHSAVIFFGVVWIFSGVNLENPAGIISTEGREFGIWALGVAVYSIVIMTVTIKLALEVSLWNIWILLSLVGSILVWFLWCVMLGMIPTSELYYAPMFLFHSPAFWYSLLLLPCLCLIPDFTYKYLKRRYYPFNFMVVQEIQRFGEDCERRSQRKRGSEKEPLLP